MKFSAKAILEYLEQQEVNSKEDYERIIQELKLEADKAKQAREARKTEKANNKKADLKTRLQEASKAILDQIKEDESFDKSIITESINGEITQNSVRISDAMNDLHYLKGKREGIEELLQELND